MSIRHRGIPALAFATLTLSGAVASAQDEAPEEAAPAEEVAPAAEPEDEDGVRFRGGVAITGGALLFSGRAAGVGGVDGRLGV